MLAYHRRAFHEMEQVDLDPLHAHFGYFVSGFEHHFMRFLRKSVNDVGTDPDAMLAELGDGIHETFRIMGAVDQLGSGIVDRLQPHFDPEVGPPVQLGQIFDDIVRQAIGPSRDRQADDAGLLQDRFVIFPQHL